MKCSKETGFYDEVGKVKGLQGQSGEPCLQGCYQLLGGGMSTTAQPA